MANNEVSVEITVEEKAALKALASLTRGVDSVAKDTVRSVGKMDLAFASFAGNIAANAVGKALNLIQEGFRKSVEAAKSLEVIEVQFRTMLGSAQAAQKQLQELQDFAATTPFQLPGLAVATRQLLSFGVAQEDIVPTLRKIGDLAAGTGSQIDELTIPYGRLISTQKLTLVELDKFADRGINLYGKLAQQTGISLKQIRDDISKGRVPFEEFEKALASLTNEGGLFFNATQKQSETLAGVISTLDDNFFNLAAEVGKAFKPALVDSAKEITGIVQNLTAAFREDGPALATATKAIADFLLITPSKFWVNFFSGGSKKNLSEINNEIETVNNKINKLQETISSKKEHTFYNSFLGRKEDDLRDMSELMMKLGELKSARDSMLKKDDDSGIIGSKDSGPADTGLSAQQQAEIEKEKVLLQEIKMLRQQSALEEEERKLLLREAQGLQTEADLERLREIEENRIAIKKEFEDQKIEIGKTGKEKDLLLEKNAAASRLELTKKTNQLELANLKKKMDEERRIRAAGYQAARNFLSAGQTLAKEGTLEAKSLAIAQSTMNTYQAAAAAIAPPPLGLGPVAGIPLMASTIALGLAQVAKISGAFAEGGFVGGMNGASYGRDNTYAQVRTGEQILNANDQREVLTGLKSGAFSNGSSKMDDLIDAIYSQPIVVNIDGIEVARAVRDARESGFAA
jgi:hypothetical protein